MSAASTTETSLITSAYPATFHEVGYARAAQEGRLWYLVHRRSSDEIGITPLPGEGDEVIATYGEGL